MLDGDDDAEIELEPTIHQGAYSPSSASQSFHMALATSSMPSLTTETGDLLRSRLKAAALFLAVGYAVFFIFGLVDEGLGAGDGTAVHSACGSPSASRSSACCRASSR